MTADRGDAVVVTWTPAGRAPRRIVFEPTDAEGAAFKRVEQAQREDGTWRPVGSEPATSVNVEDGRDD